jgi:hypothetical protein
MDRRRKGSRNALVGEGSYVMIRLAGAGGRNDMKALQWFRCWLGHNDLEFVTFADMQYLPGLPVVRIYRCRKCNTEHHLTLDQRSLW